MGSEGLAEGVEGFQASLTARSLFPGCGFLSLITLEPSLLLYVNSFLRMLEVDYVYIVYILHMDVYSFVFLLKYCTIVLFFTFV